MEVKIDKLMLNVGDVIEWTPDKGSLKGMTLTCIVVDVLRVFDTTTFEPMFRTVYSYEPWMEKYIGTTEDIRKDENFKNN